MTFSRWKLTVPKDLGTSPFEPWKQQALDLLQTTGHYLDALLKWKKALLPSAVAMDGAFENFLEGLNFIHTMGVLDGVVHLELLKHLVDLSKFWVCEASILLYPVIDSGKALVEDISSSSLAFSLAIDYLWNLQQCCLSKGLVFLHHSIKSLFAYMHWHFYVCPPPSDASTTSSIHPPLNGVEEPHTFHMVQHSLANLWLPSSLHKVQLHW